MASMGRQERLDQADIYANLTMLKSDFTTLLLLEHEMLVRVLGM